MVDERRPSYGSLKGGGEEGTVRHFSGLTEAAMEFLVGPTFSVDVSSSPDYVRDRKGVPPPPEEDGAASSCSSPEKQEQDGAVKIGSGVGFGGRGEALDDDDSEASSSIGVPDDDTDGDGDGDGVDESKLDRGLASLGSLEDSLPIKRGLSNHFSGKSKSFANLTEACSTKDLEKPENPFNKRRRVLIQAKLLRKSSFYAWRNPKSMPLLALNEDEEEEAPPAKPEEDDEEEEERVPKWPQRRVKNMKSFSCFSLSEMGNHHLQQLQE